MLRAIGTGFNSKAVASLLGPAQPLLEFVHPMEILNFPQQLAARLAAAPSALRSGKMREEHMNSILREGKICRERTS